MNIELYIDNQLCDIESSISIRLKRKFINPSELNVKDAQRSYNINLPTTGKNNKIFGFTHIEETARKFVKIYDAVLIVDGVTVLDGKFRLSEITRSYYKGNLGIPKQLTAGDVFGESNMNEMGKWEIDFQQISSITDYNNQENPPCFFPLVMYSLFPKEPGERGYSAKDTFDGSVYLGLEDIPPSVNCIEMLKKIFANARLKLGGTALKDTRLNTLYVSYKNQNEYNMPYPASSLIMEGSWSTLKDGATESSSSFVNGEGDSMERARIVTNILNADNNTISFISDRYGNFRNSGLYKSIIAPVSGYYKIKFQANISMGTETADGISSGDLDNVHTEIKLVKNYSKGLNNVMFENVFRYVIGSKGIYPAENEVNFIDPETFSDSSTEFHFRNLVCGFSFGKFDNNFFNNPLTTTYCNPMALCGGLSRLDRSTDFVYSAVQSSGYKRATGEDTGLFKVDVTENSFTNRNNTTTASGVINQIVWLEKNDRLDIIDVAFRDGNNAYNRSIDYNLTVEPIIKDINWLPMGSDGSSYSQINWDTPSQITGTTLDLIKFLPSNVRVNDWIDNFCNAFNLSLVNTEDNTFELNVKSVRSIKNISRVIDIDSKASVLKSYNTPLDVPYSYELGFTVDTDEQGYFESSQIDEDGEIIPNTANTGKGIFYTGSLDSNTISQTSNFSYTWYKWIKFISESGEETQYRLPIITSRDIWEASATYEEAMQETFYDQPQRFWFKSNANIPVKVMGVDAQAAQVKNSSTNLPTLILDYTGGNDTITDNFFLLLNNSRHYTIVECYLTVEEYEQLPYSLVKFNGDIYNVAGIDGFDPTNRNLGKLELIKKE